MQTAKGLPQSALFTYSREIYHKKKESSSPYLRKNKLKLI